LLEEEEEEEELKACVLSDMLWKTGMRTGYIIRVSEFIQLDVVLQIFICSVFLPEINYILTSLC